MTRSANRFLILLIVAGLIGAAWWWNRQEEPVAVTAAAVELGPVAKTVANTRAGTVTACNRARLSPSVGGQVAVLDVEEGELVKKGRVLLELWNLDLKAEVELAAAERKTADSKSTAACLQAEVAEREAERLSSLRKTGATSEDALDKAVTQAKSARASCAAAEASILVSTAQLDRAQARLERTRLVAPFDGVVANINGELNEYITPSPPGIPTPTVVDLIGADCYYVVAPIDEVDVAAVAMEMPVRITLDAYDERQFPGQVRRIAPYVQDYEKQARTVDVEVDFQNSDDLALLLAGYSADVEIVLSDKASVLRIPTEAVIGGTEVYVVDPGSGVLQRRDIQTGLSNWDYTEVIEGLDSGDLVVTSLDRDGVDEGALVRVESADE